MLWQSGVTFNQRVAGSNPAGALKRRDRGHEPQQKHEHNRNCPDGGERRATAARHGDHLPKAGDATGLTVCPRLTRR
jgi:hypothetical protein